MKKLVILLVSFVLLSVIGYGQGATPTAQVRVSNNTTAFNINVPIGYTVYDISADKYFVCKTATASTLTLTTGAANFTQIGGSGLGGTVTSVTGKRMNVTNGTTTPRLLPMVGIAGDSLVKMDSTASAGQIAVFSTNGTGLAGRSNASMASQLGVKVYKVFETEATVDSLTRYIYALSVTPVSTSVEVKINGSNLKATSQYTINGTKIYILAPIRTYDHINITCSY